MHATTAQTGVKFSYISHTKLVQIKKKSVLKILVLPYSLNFTFALVGFGNDEIVYFIIYSAAQLHLVEKQDTPLYPFPHSPPKEKFSFSSFPLFSTRPVKLVSPMWKCFSPLEKYNSSRKKVDEIHILSPDFRKALAARLSAS